LLFEEAFSPQALHKTANVFTAPYVLLVLRFFHDVSAVNSIVIIRLL